MVDTQRDDARTRDVFDRVVGRLEGMTGVVSTRPATVTTVLPMLGDAQTYVVQTYRDEDGSFWLLLQHFAAGGGVRIPIPPKVVQTIYRQRESLVKTSRRNRGLDRWAGMTNEERRERTKHLRKEG